MLGLFRTSDLEVYTVSVCFSLVILILIILLVRLISTTNSLLIFLLLKLMSKRSIGSTLKLCRSYFPSKFPLVLASIDELIFVPLQYFLHIGLIKKSLLLSHTQVFINCGLMNSFFSPIIFLWSNLQIWPVRAPSSWFLCFCKMALFFFLIRLFLEQF